MKVPPGMTLTDVTSFAYTLAQVIYNYKVATHRTGSERELKLFSNAMNSDQLRTRRQRSATGTK